MIQVRTDLYILCSLFRQRQTHVSLSCAIIMTLCHKRVNVNLSHCALNVKELRRQLAVTMCLLLFYQLIKPLDEILIPINYAS